MRIFTLLDRYKCQRTPLNEMNKKLENSRPPLSQPFRWNSCQPNHPLVQWIIITNQVSKIYSRFPGELHIPSLETCRLFNSIGWRRSSNFAAAVQSLFADLVVFTSNQWNQCTAVNGHREGFVWLFASPVPISSCWQIEECRCALWRICYVFCQNSVVTEPTVGL